MQHRTEQRPRHAPPPFWEERRVRVVLAPDAARALYQRTRGSASGQSGDGRSTTFRVRGAGQAAPVGQVTVRWNEPRPNEATIRHIAWDAARIEENRLWKTLGPLIGRANGRVHDAGRPTA